MARQRKQAPCPIAAAASIVSRKWVPLILRDLSEGTRRFNELQRSIGISPRVLAARLQELERAEIVTRQCFAEVPPRVEYTLTRKGRTLIPMIEEMRRFGRTLL